MTTQLHLFEQADADFVVLHEGFFRLERCHLGHMGKCEPAGTSGHPPCWRFDVGVSVTFGRVNWWSGATVAEALARAAHGIRVAAAHGRIDETEGYLG